MGARIKPILGMWCTLLVLSFVTSLLLPEWGVPSAPLLGGIWPTVILNLLIVTLFFHWVVVSTGLGALHTAVILALSGMLSTSVANFMFEGMRFAEAVGGAVAGLVFWLIAGGVYGWLSSKD